VKTVRSKRCLVTDRYRHEHRKRLQFMKILLKLC